ncbi:MAG: hypothetical protein U5K31_05495 [Balneolaceae bacterium]|nr:hypothetical protein [Balneolaceae bacterium]
MKKQALLFLLLPVLIFACRQESGTEQGSAATSTADSTLFEVKEALFDATLTRISTEETSQIRSEGEGPTVWDRSGSLEFVLAELYRSPVELEANPYEGNTFALELAWRDDTSLEEIREEVARYVQEALGYTLQTATRTQLQYRLSLDDTSRLLTASDTDFASEGTLSKASIGDGNWRIYGNLEKLAQVFRQETDSMVVAAPEQDSTAYYFELTDTSDLESMVDQLQSKYGVSVSEQSVEVEYHTIHFSARE